MDNNHCFNEIIEWFTNYKFEIFIGIILVIALNIACNKDHRCKKCNRRTNIVLDDIGKPLHRKCKNCNTTYLEYE